MMKSLALVFLALLISSPSALAQNQLGAEARLKEKNISLPAPASPVANYVSSVKVGNLLFLAGEAGGIPWRGKGKLGKDLTVEQGRQAARDTGLRMLATTREALGSLDKVKRIVKVLGMVNSVPEFTEQAQVIDGFSDLMVEVFGEPNGKHARSAVGMASLPFGHPVEIEMIVEVYD
jgi:enamine deaminase RidA (YjgF/YER057c/UK114 family)